jgi:cardiolipin synthase
VAANPGPGDQPGPAGDERLRIVTVPNALSVLRLLGIPVFCWLVLGPHADVAAFFVLAASGITDWLDGKLARSLNQQTRLGELLDPLVDRLYILATLGVLSARGIIPWALAVAIVARDVLLAATLPGLRRHGYGPLPVHVLGKAATGCLLYAFPLLLLGAGPGTGPTIARVVGWAFAIWGTALYWWAGVLYAVQAHRLIRGKDPDQGSGAVRDLSSVNGAPPTPKLASSG